MRPHSMRRFTATPVTASATALLLVSVVAAGPAQAQDDPPPSGQEVSGLLSSVEGLLEETGLVGPAEVPATLPGTDDMMATIEDLVDMAPRSTGSEGGRQAADYVADRFRGAGLSDVHFEEVPSYDWKPSDYSLAVGETPIDAFPVSYSMIAGATQTGTTTLGPDGRTAEVVDVGSGKIGDTDVAGKWVLFDLKFTLPLGALVPLITFLYDPGLEMLDLETLMTANPYVTNQQGMFQDAMAAGAEGVIGVLADYFDSNRYHNEYYRRVDMTIPGMWVTIAEGERLRQELAQGDGTATMRLTVDRDEVTARTVVGFLPGDTDDTIMVQSHHDSQGPGAVEDASGTAEVIALAEHYAAEARAGATRDKTLMFITFDTHFTGYQSHMAFVDKYITRQETPYRIVANATIEHIGKKAVIGPEGELVTLDQTEPRGIFENLSLLLKLKLDSIIVANDLGPMAVLNATPTQLLGGIPTDASFVLTAGVPVVSLIAGPLYMYDDADTLDKIDQEQLVPIGNAYRQIIDAMDETPSGAIGLLPPVVTDLLGSVTGPLVSALTGSGEPSGPTEPSSPSEPSEPSEPSDDSFYRPSSGIRGQPGTVIDSRPATGVAALPEAGQATTVLYRSTGVSGDPVAMSGTVLVPPGEPPGEGWPLVTWDHMTTGVADVCAPSSIAATSSEISHATQGDALVARLLEAGVAVAKPDYEGLGTDGPHPYLIGDSLATATADMAAAARDLDPRIGRQWIAAGQSEGGVAALFTGESDRALPESVDLVGVSAFVPPTRMSDLIDTFRNVPVAAGPTGDLVALAALIAYGAATVDPELAALLPAGGVSDQALELWPDLEERCFEDLASSDSFGGLAPSQIVGPRGDDLLALLDAIVDDNDVRHLRLRDVPVRLDSGLLDLVVPLPFAEGLAASYRAAGVDLTYERWLAGHSPITSSAAAVAAASTWMLDVFAGAGASADADADADAAHGVPGGGEGGGDRGRGGDAESTGRDQPRSGDADSSLPSTGSSSSLTGVLAGLLLVALGAKLWSIGRLRTRSLGA